MLTAKLIVKRTPPNPGRRDAYLYDVEFDGEVIVSSSHNPEHEGARALLARGVTGKLTLIDSGTGKPCTIINIEKAAALTVVDDNWQLGSRKYREPRIGLSEGEQTEGGSPSAGETPSPATALAEVA
jgi:hypothetical protein